MGSKIEIARKYSDLRIIQSKPSLAWPTFLTIPLACDMATVLGLLCFSIAIGLQFLGSEAPAFNRGCIFVSPRPQNAIGVAVFGLQGLKMY